jgi:hypothetical protein
LAIGAAWALIQARSREVSFGSIKEYPEGGVRVSLPSGWKTLLADDLPVGGVVGVAEGSSSDRSRRRLFVFRGIPRPLGVPSSDGIPLAVVAAESAGKGMPLALLRDRYPSSGRVGRLPGWTVALGPVVEPRQGGPQGPYCLVRIAVGPGGETVGVVLQSGRVPTRADERLLDRVCLGLEMTDLSFVEDAQAAMSAAGIRFDPPAGAELVANSDPSLALVRMMGGEGVDAWYLDIYRVPLIGERTAEGLVEDRVLFALQQARLPGAVEIAEVGDRRAARLHFSPLDNRKPTVCVMAAGTDEGTALLLVGRHELDAQQMLMKICAMIVETAEVSPYDELIDTAAAVQTGKRGLASMTAQGLDLLFGPVAGQERVYQIASPGMTLGREVRICRRDHEEDEDQWQIAARWDYRVLGAAVQEVFETWSISASGAEHTLQSRRDVNGRTEMDYDERRQAGSDRVERNLGVVTGSKVIRRDLDVVVDETYSCEPVMLAFDSGQHQDLVGMARDETSRASGLVSGQSPRHGQAPAHVEAGRMERLPEVTSAPD